METAEPVASQCNQQSGPGATTEQDDLAASNHPKPWFQTRADNTFNIIQQYRFMLAATMLAGHLAMPAASAT